MLFRSNPKQIPIPIPFFAPFVSLRLCAIARRHAQRRKEAKSAKVGWFPFSDFGFSTFPLVSSFEFRISSFQDGATLSQMEPFSKWLCDIQNHRISSPPQRLRGGATVGAGTKGPSDRGKSARRRVPQFLRPSVPSTYYTL